MRADPVPKPPPVETDGGLATLSALLGALGALSATGPAEAIVQALGWRGLFAVLAVASAAVALLILLVVPESKPATPAATSPRIGFLTIYMDRCFLRIAPLAALGIGTSFSLQGLWAAPWLTDVAGLDRSAVVGHLTLMAAALAASALLLGAVAERLRRAGIPTELFLAGTLVLSMTAQLALLLGLPVPSYLLFSTVAAGGVTTVLSFAALAQYFPKEVSGRANAALGVLIMGTAFGLQCLSGFIVALWPADGGRYLAEAHAAAMAAGLCLQLVALGVFCAPRRLPRPAPMAAAVGRALRFGGSPPVTVRPVYASWTHQAELARRQRAAWAFAAVASAALCLGLAATLSIAIARPAIALHVIELPLRAGTGTSPGQLSRWRHLDGREASYNDPLARTLRGRNSFCPASKSRGPASFQRGGHRLYPRRSQAGSWNKILGRASSREAR